MASIKIDSGDGVFTALSHVNTKSANRKIGDVAQTWIMIQDEQPSKAYVNGHDLKICFDCPLTSKASGGNGGCYVVVIHGPDGVWKATHGADVSSVPKIDKVVRFGAYGDPAATDIKVIRKLAKSAKGHIGYTHQWHKRKNLSPFCMASIDPVMASEQGVTSRELKAQAHARGYRTFRILENDELPMADEILCPNETHGVQCDKCKLCGGTSRKAKNIAIHAHGVGQRSITSPAPSFGPKAWPKMADEATAEDIDYDRIDADEYRRRSKSV
jgi:hypothetical protein